MGRSMGLPKTGGRKKGIPNKKTKELSGRLEALDFDPIKELTVLVKGINELSTKDRAEICLDLLQYLYPKRKALDVSPEQGPRGDIVYVTSWGGASEETKTKGDF